VLRRHTITKAASRSLQKLFEKPSMMMVRSAIPGNAPEKDIRLRKECEHRLRRSEPKVMLLSEGGENHALFFRQKRFRWDCS